MSTDPTVAAAEGPLVIDSGPLVMQATTDPSEQQEEGEDGGDRAGAGE